MASTLEPKAALSERATQIGIEPWLVEKIKDKHFDAYGKLAFAVAYLPQHADDRPFRDFMNDLAEQILSDELLEGFSLRLTPWHWQMRGAV